MNMKLKATSALTAARVCEVKKVMNNDLYIHANGLLERFKHEAEKAKARRDWIAANTWYNAVSIVEEPEVQEEILKKFPTVKFWTVVKTMRFSDAE